MGYDPTRFDCPVDDELKCPICCFVLQDAVQAPNCEHTFCQHCITQWLSHQASCPVDRQPLSRSDLKPAPRVLRNFLAKLDIRCDFASGGCVAVVKLELLQSHMDTCDFNPNKSVMCEKGCGLEMRRDQVDNHNCLSDLRDLISKQDALISELRVAKTTQSEQIADMKGTLKRLLEQDLTERDRQVHSLQQQVNRMQNLMDSMQQKQSVLSQQQQMIQQSLRCNSPTTGITESTDSDSLYECDCEPSPRSCIFQQQQQQQTSSSSLIPRKRIHSWKGKDFPAKRLPTPSGPVSGGKPCHGYGLIDVHERSAPSPFSESEILRHNYYHNHHLGHNHNHSHHSPTSPPDDQALSSSPSASSSQHHTQLITFYGQILTVNLRGDDTVEDVKMKILQQEGIPPDQQLLFFAGQQLEDEKPLTHYGLFSTTTETAKHLVLRLRDGMKIFVKTLSDKTIEVQVDPSETIEIVKVKIHEQEGISPCDQRLLIDGRDLYDMKTLSEYGIKHKATLHLDLHFEGPCAICQSQFQNSGNTPSSSSPGRSVSAGKGHGHMSPSTASVATSTSSPSR